VTKTHSFDNPFNNLYINQRTFTLALFINHHQPFEFQCPVILSPSNNSSLNGMRELQPRIATGPGALQRARRLQRRWMILSEQRTE
jgi:hypothetical protein